MKISIIIPVYNVELYIARCLDSIINQSGFIASNLNLEILVVNDGSPDNCQQIIDAYVKKYTFIKSFVKENGGLSDARNFGLSKASGDYIWFVDSDDWINENSLKTVFQEIENGELDVLEFNFSRKFNDSDEKLYLDPYYSKFETSIISGKTSIEMVGYSISVWNKLFKRKLLNRIGFHFPLNRISEDTVPTLLAVLNADKYKKISQCLYFYYLRAGSITSEKASHQLKKAHYDQILNIREMQTIANSLDKNIASKINEMQLFIAINVLHSAVLEIGSNEYFQTIVSHLSELGIYPIKKYTFHNKFTREIFRAFVNSKVLTSLFFTFNRK